MIYLQLHFLNLLKQDSIDCFTVELNLLLVLRKIYIVQRTGLPLFRNDQTRTIYSTKMWYDFKDL